MVCKGNAGEKCLDLSKMSKQKFTIHSLIYHLTLPGSVIEVYDGETCSTHAVSKK